MPNDEGFYRLATTTQPKKILVGCDRDQSDLGAVRGRAWDHDHYRKSSREHGKGGANRILLSRDEQALCCRNAARNFFLEVHRTKIVQPIRQTRTYLINTFSAG